MSAARGDAGLALLGSAIDTGNAPEGVNSLDMHVEIAVEALADAGVEPAEIDGLVTFGSYTMPHSLHVMTVLDRLGLRGLRYAECVQVGGASAVAALNRVARLAAAGKLDTVLLVAADNQRTGIATSGALGAMFANRHPLFEQPYGPTTAALYALRATRYLHDFDLPAELLSYAVVASREHAVRSGRVAADAAVTFEEVEASRMITSPLRLLHCSRVTDGAAAVVASRTSGRGGEVELLGAGEYQRAGYYIHGAGPGPLGAGPAAEIALGEAGLGIGDIRVAYVYDAFASSVGATVEELGLAAPGTAYQRFRDGELSGGGEVFVNPHGGLLSLGNPSFPSGLYHVAAAVADLKADKVDGDLALVHGSGGVMSEQAVAILGRT
jgi:acetyl-CoA acetyltransferase